MPELPKSIDITPPTDPPKVEPVISLDSLTSFFSPQTLKLIGYIKNQKVIILIESGSTHNFIHHRVAQETHFHIHVVNNFRIMIANGGFMKYAGRYENVCLQIGKYNLKSHVFVIDMGGCDIVLGEEWLHTLGPIFMDFKELTMKFQHVGQQYKFQGITAGSPEIISSHRMEKLLKKVISTLFPNSIIFKQLRHLWCILTSNVSSLDTNLFFPLPRYFLLLVVFMIIPFLSSPTVFLPMFALIIIPSPKRMKLRKLFKNF
jgi:hypothetical protein